jgi:tetratricopeptide (TPR) repeat protein
MSFTTTRLRSQFEQVQQLRAQGQTAVADMLARQIVAAVPTGVDDLYCQASLLLGWNRAADALKRFDAARTRGRVPPELLVDRAVALNELRRAEEAIASCQEALALQPRFAPAHLVWGDALVGLEHHDDALAQYGAALKADAGFAPARHARAALLMKLSRAEGALPDLRRLLQQSPNDATLHNRMGLALAELQHFDEALAAFDRAVALAPRDAGLWHNRGVTLWSLERYAEALASYDKALALNAGLYVTLSNRANTLQELSRFDEAMVVHDRVVATWPDYVSGHWNRSQGRMLLGDWAGGLPEFEWRRQRADVKDDYLPDPCWTGSEDIAGKTLLIRAEMGLGDTIQFARYAALAQERGARVVLAVQAPLVRLMTESLVPAVDQVIGKYDPQPLCDYHIASMSLPLAFGTTPQTAPNRVPYLKADPARAAAWKDKLGANGFKIGICWRGGQAGNDMGRSFPLALLAPIAALPGVRLISLQKGEGAAQLNTLPRGMAVETLGEDFDNGPDAFLDTIAVMESLDLVISCDTSIPHLAGALARPLWLATRMVPEWRWLLGRDDSVWYPTARLFRQEALGDWSAPFAHMQNELVKLLAKQETP